MSGVAAVVLAAGASTRFGPQSPKQLAVFEGELLVRRASRAALDSRCDAVFVVVGAHAEAVEQALAGLAVETLRNEAWRSGMASSIACGVAAARDRFEAVLVCLADQPRVGAADLDALIARFAAGSEIAACHYHGASGVPALFAARHFSALSRLEGDRGARSLLQQHVDDVALVPCPHASVDVDTPEDLAAL